MEFGPLLFASAPLHLAGMRITAQGVTLVMVPTTDFGHCPTCGCRSARVHSHYPRTLQDVPACGRLVSIELYLRRFFCDLPDCPQHTFAEQLPQVTLPHARKTARLIDSLQEMGFTAGGEPAARLATQLGMPVSGDTLLRLVRKARVGSDQSAVRVLGVDDWAIRRGQTYGTILCDLETHEPIDLLPERSSKAFADWLGQHAGVEIISRDRGGDYAKGGSQGAPQAKQVADRWHLLCNLTDALQRGIDARQSTISEAAQEVAAALAPVPPLPGRVGPAVPAAPPPRLSRREQRKQASRTRRLACYQKVQELHRQGMSICGICRMLKLSRQTTKRFARCESFPERATPTARPSRARLIDPYAPYLRQRWQEGCAFAPQLFEEIKSKGFVGSVYMVRRLVRRWRRAAGVRCERGRQPLETVPRMIRPSARRIAWLALGHVKKPSAQDEAVLQGIYRRWPQLQETAELARQFGGLLREHDADSLEAWVQLAEGPMILGEVRRFAELLRQDWAAVVEAVRGPWSQGQVEGQINRLKLIKRQMYGRARFDLLRQRVLHAKRA